MAVSLLPVWIIGVGVCLSPAVWAIQVTTDSSSSSDAVSDYDVGFGANGLSDREEPEFTDEQRLLRFLTTNYDPSVRPVFDNKKPVTVHVGITLTQIIDVDEKNQVLTTNVWLDQNWHDEKLKWNSTDFNNITIIRVPCDLLWLPDIVLYNSVDDHNKGYMRSLAMVWSTGKVFWPPIVRMRSSCKMDITFFPFDDQVCKLMLGSWAYDGFQVDVQNNSVEVDLTNYVNNGEWELLGTKSIRHVKTYSCCPEPYIDVTFYLLIRRRVLYYFLNVIIPCMLLSTLSLTGFLLPPDSGEKVTLGLTVLLAFSVFMLLVAENMPPTSEYIPLIGIYLTVIMAMSALSVALSVFVLNCHHRGSMLHRPPRWVRLLAYYMAKVLFVRLNYLNKTGNPKPPGGSKHGPTAFQSMPYAALHEGIVASSASSVPGSHTGSQQPLTYSTTVLTTPSTPQSTNDRPPSVDLSCSNGCSLTHTPQTRAPPSIKHGPDRLKDSRSAVLENQIMHYLQAVLEAFDNTGGEKAAVLEWQEVARVMDKFFFVLFVSITVLATIFLLLLSPITKNVDLPPDPSAG